MKIAIIDCDYQSGVARFPNPFLMKVSSFYKQKGDTVTFEDFELTMSNYDYVYIGRMLKASEEPKTYFKIHDKVVYYDTNINSLGLDIRRFPSAIAKARPDYTLYDFKFDTEYTKANFLQYSNYDEVIHTQTSKQHNLVNPINIIMDQSLWALPPVKLIPILTRIKSLKKVYFLYPIDYSALFNRDILENFLAIPLSPSIHQNFQNFTENWHSIIEVQKVIKDSGKKMAYLVPKMRVDIDKFISNEIEYTEELIKVCAAAKAKGVRLEIQDSTFPDGKLQLLIGWSRSKKSLLDFGTANIQEFHHMIAAEAISTPRLWDDRTQALAHLIMVYPHLFEEITTGWQGVKNAIDKINLDRIQEGLLDDIPIL